MIRASSSLRVFRLVLAIALVSISGQADCAPPLLSISKAEAIAKFNFAAHEPDIDVIPEAVVRQSELVSPSLRGIPEDLPNPKVIAMERVSPKVFDRFGYSIFSFGKLNDVTVPGFSGLVVEPDTNRIIANLVVVKNTRGTSKHSTLLEVTIKLARMFNRPGDWYKTLIASVFEQSRTISWHQAHLNFLDERTSNRFREQLTWFTALAKFYGVGHQRPIWILLDLPDDSRINFERVSLSAHDIFARANRNPLLRPDKILVHGNGELLVLEQDASAPGQMCVDTLRVKSSK